MYIRCIRFQSQVFPSSVANMPADSILHSTPSQIAISFFYDCVHLIFRLSLRVLYSFVWKLIFIMPVSESEERQLNSSRLFETTRELNLFAKMYYPTAAL